MRCAVVCASGIGDALLMQIGANHLHKLGADVTLFSNHIGQLASWFPDFHFAPQPQLDKIDALLAPFDLILLQHDNSPKAKQIRAMGKPVYVLYGSHLVSKHGLFRPQFDFLFDPRLCMAENIKIACGQFFPEIEATKENGLIPCSTFTFRRHTKRVAIHPTSSAPSKNWTKEGYRKLHQRLARDGYEPVFIVPPDEAEEWSSPSFPSLSALASFLYESAYFIGNDSGPGHLASNLGLPTLIIGPSKKQLSLWRPGWAPGLVAYPPLWTSLKALQSRWKYFITVNQVAKQFTKLTVIK